MSLFHLLKLPGLGAELQACASENSQPGEVWGEQQVTPQRNGFPRWDELKGQGNQPALKLEYAEELIM